MTDPDSTITDTVSQAQGESQEAENETQNGYSTTQHSNNTGAAEWTNLIQPSLANTDTNTANLNRDVHVKGNLTSEEYTRQLNYFNMQNNTYLKAGYPDTRAYCGWLPGLSSVQLPALIYPHSFLGFTPTVAWMKTSGNTPGEAANIEKIDRWEGARKDSASSEASESEQDINTVYTDETNYSSEQMKSINSDEDEGLVLDERETIKRRRQKEVKKLQTESIKPQPERSSVIQENVSIQAKPSGIAHAQDATKSTEQEQSRPAKRGRASTRQIEKTDQYWDRRKKNNVSAKKSRDARRQRESMINQHSAMLETENLRFRAELATLRDENTRLKQELSSLKNTTS